MGFRSLVLTAVLASLATFPSSGFAAASNQTFHAIVFIDVIPPDKAIGLATLAGYVRRARQEPGVQSIIIIQQAAIPNHFILEEAFQDEAAYQRFSSAAWVRAFRAALFPHLGSPWDERLGIASPEAVVSASEG